MPQRQPDPHVPTSPDAARPRSTGRPSRRRPARSRPGRWAVGLISVLLALVLLPLGSPAPGADADPRAGLPRLTGSGSTLLRQSEQRIAPGLDLTSFQRLQPGGWVTGHVMTADLSTPSLSLDVTDGGTVSDSIDTVSSLAADAGAVAAVNGDYFDTNASEAPIGTNVSPSGGLRTAAPEPRQTFTMTDGRAAVQELMSSATAEVGGRSIDVAAVNSPSWRADQVALFTPVWGSHPVGRLVPADEPVTAVTVVDGEVTAVSEDRADLAEPLAEDASLLIARGSARAELAGISLGEPVDVSLRASADVDLAVGGSQRLLVEGEVTDEDQATASRTAIGVSEDGTRLLVVAIDGRQADAHGMTVAELSELMAELGAWNAVNLDGGGSTTMVARPAGGAELEVVNRPSDGTERRDANALVFRSEAAGAPADVLARPALAPAAGLAVEGSHELLPGLSRTVLGSGLDADLAAAPADGRFSASPRRVLSTAPAEADVAVVPGQDAVVVRGERTGRGVVGYAGRLESGRRSDRVELVVRGEMVRLEASTTVLALAPGGDEPPAQEPPTEEPPTEEPPGDQPLPPDGSLLSFTAVDADGHRVPVETRDVELQVGPGITVEPTGPAEFRVTPTTEQTGASQLVATVLGQQTTIPVTIGFQTQAVAEFADGADWRVGTDRATATLNPAEGPDGEPALALDHDFTTSTATRGAYALPPAPIAVAGQPQAFTLWIDGDGQGAWSRLQVSRGDGTSTNLDGPFVDWTGWRQVSFPVPAGTAYPLQVTGIRFLEIEAAKSYVGGVTIAGLAAQVPVDVEQPVPPYLADPVILGQGDVTDRPQRVAVLSDTQFVARDGADGELVQAGRRALREIVAADPDLLLVAGDLVDEASPADLELARTVLTEEVGEAVPWVYVPGNHEIMGGGIEVFQRYFGDTMTVRDLGATRVITLDSSEGTLHPGGSTDQLRELEAQLADAAARRTVTGVLVVDHHPIRDPHPDAASQLTDRVEAAALQRVLADFRGRGKSIAMVSGHVGTFHADAEGGISRIINGNSGKSPSGAPDRGGFTGWSMLGLDPGAGIVGTDPDLGSSRTDWLQVQTHPRVDALALDAPAALTVGAAEDVAATLTQDGDREVPVAWPVTARWGGAGVEVVSNGPSGVSGSDGAVVELDPTTGELTALRTGTATLEVTVNGVTAEQQITVTD